MTLARLIVNEGVARHVERAADARVVDCETRSSPRLRFCIGMPQETWQALGQGTERAVQDMRQCLCATIHKSILKSNAAIHACLVESDLQLCHGGIQQCEINGFIVVHGTGSHECHRISSKPGCRPSLTWMANLFQVFACSTRLTSAQRRHQLRFLSNH
jgi:hypothetical protein